ncbi:GNAT family N-acetyltransferase [Actinomadura rugatobispora]|uniref:GNAT family N-acetyltransferase n=1 Tax=Actinomadura rugatobispora TaxID=1994 RepID=A0ABW0ZU92_9ACTN|nr:GNAT family N-acetyltransferase [Actinomadura rugatobispora]
MSWDVSGNPEEFLAAAGGFLYADPVRNTVLLTVTETLRVRGVHVYGDLDPSFGWWRSGTGEVRGAFVHTPPRAVQLSPMPEPAVRELVEVLPDEVTGLGAEAAVGQTFAAAWEHRTGRAGEVQLRERLYRLERLEAPRVPGEARLATSDDRRLLLAWLAAFREDAGLPHGVNPAVTDDKLDYGGYLLWVDGEPVSLAGRTRVVAGMARVAPVYTPLERRRLGYGGAVTAAATRAALDAGAREVVLFTDLANPTTNSLYPRLGYRPVADVLQFAFRGGS